MILLNQCCVWFIFSIFKGFHSHNSSPPQTMALEKQSIFRAHRMTAFNVCEWFLLEKDTSEWSYLIKVASESEILRKMLYVQSLCIFNRLIIKISNLFHYCTAWVLYLKNRESCFIDDCPVIGPNKPSFLGFVICLAAEREKVIYMTETEAPCKNLSLSINYVGFYCKHFSLSPLRWLNVL